MDLNLKSKSSLRMTYEAQVEVIKRQIGGLEELRSKLGLSQRKMAQLLLVDPSAWTRWLANEKQIPPHIWRSLQWYFSLQEKIPGLTPQYFLGGDSKQLQTQIEHKVLSHVENQLMQQQLTQQAQMNLSKKSIDLMQTQLQTQFSSEIQTLKDENRKLKLWIWVAYGFCLASLILFFAVRV